MDGLPAQATGLTLGIAEPEGPEEVSAAYGDLGMDCLQLGSVGGGIRVISAKLGDIRFGAMVLMGALRMRGTTLPGHVTIQVDLGSNPGRRLDGELLARDDVVVGSGPASFELVTGLQHRGMNLAIPVQLALDAFDQRAPGIVPLPNDTRLHVVASSAPDLATVRRLTDAMIAFSHQPFAAAVSTFAGSAIVDAVVGAILTPAYRAHAGHFRMPHYQRWPIVRRPEEFMRANLSDAVVLHDICRAARASERSVSYAFHDIYGIGPMQFLRLLRLNQVRRELKAMPSEAATVADIAHSYGLFHAGHFFTNYRRLFGETPGLTRTLR